MWGTEGGVRWNCIGPTAVVVDSASTECPQWVFWVSKVRLLSVCCASTECPQYVYWVSIKCLLCVYWMFTVRVLSTYSASTECLLWVYWVSTSTVRLLSVRSVYYANTEWHKQLQFLCYPLLQTNTYYIFVGYPLWLCIKVFGVAQCYKSTYVPLLVSTRFYFVCLCLSLLHFGVHVYEKQFEINIALWGEELKLNLWDIFVSTCLPRVLSEM